LIYAAANCRGLLNRLLSLAWLVFLGEVSYGIYILHMPLAFWCLWIWRKISGHLPEPTMVYFLVYFFGMVAVCSLAFVLIEVPARMAVSRLLKTRLQGGNAVKASHSQAANTDRVDVPHIHPPNVAPGDNPNLLSN
jgi:peptidoglycan/LPS O-acetylase OafA/YrhL